MGNLRDAPLVWGWIVGKGLESGEMQVKIYSGSEWAEESRFGHFHLPSPADYSND